MDCSTSPPSRTAPTPSWSGETTSSISPLMEKCLRTHSPSPPSPPRTTPMTQPPGCLRPTDGDSTSTSGAPDSPNSSTNPVRHRGGHLGSPVRRRHNPRSEERRVGKEGRYGEGASDVREESYR